MKRLLWVDRPEGFPLPLGAVSAVGVVRSHGIQPWKKGFFFGAHTIEIYLGQWDLNS